MIDFKTFRLLNETLGFYALGLKSPTNLGYTTEGGMSPFMGGAGGPPGGGMSDAPPSNDMGADPTPGQGDDSGHDSDDEKEDKDPADMSHEELIAALTELGHEESELQGMEDEDLRDMLIQAKDGDKDGSDDADMNADHDDDMSDAGGEGSEDDHLMLPPKKPAGPFMKKEAFEKVKEEKVSKKHKKVEKEDDEDEDEDKDEEEKLHHKKKKSKCEDKPTFMMKKKCGSGMGKDVVIDSKCKNCEKIKKEAAVTPPPADYDPSEAAFFKSVKNQLSKTDVGRRWDDGMNFKTEDLLLPPDVGADTPQPGQPGYAPQGRIGGEFTAEAVKDMLKRMDNLGK